MGISIQKVLKSLPENRQKKIKAKADSYILDYKNLASVRKDLGITQEDIAKHQGVKQVSISNLERRDDMLISTLQKYVASLGGKLEIRISFPDKANKPSKKLNIKSGKATPKSIRQRASAKKA